MSVLQILMIFTLVFIGSCGGEEKSTHIRDYRFIITEPGASPGLAAELTAVFKNINEATGSRKFRLVEKASDANSFINLSNVQKMFGHNSIGAGAKTYTVEEKTTGLGRFLVQKTSTFYYGMDIDLDRNWVKNNLELSSQKPARHSRNAREVRSSHRPQNDTLTSSNFLEQPNRMFEILLLHEIGHGLGFGHVESQDDVMFALVSEDKDLQAFYQRISAFLNRPATR